MDPITVGGAITAGHHAISLLKGITQAIRGSGKLELQGDLIELQTAMLDILQKHHDLTTQNSDLHTRIKELEAQLALTHELTFEEPGIYWRTKDGKRDGPFCPVCYDRDKKLIRLHDARQRAAHCEWLCLVCKGQWGHKNPGKPPSAQRWPSPSKLDGFSG